MNPLPKIGEKQFRILKVTQIEPLIQCEVVVRNLPSSRGASPEYLYFALSYAWGETHQSCVINVNRHPLRITEHLGAALRGLYCREEVRNAWHWVDQICIDQTNETEKALQVGAMHLIYTYAKRTLIWLGSEYDDSDLALRGIDTMVDEFGESPYPSTESAKKVIQDRLAPRNHEVWPAIVKLYGRSWFGRVWILQEVALSDGAFVLCGNRTLTWDKLARFANGISAVWPGVLMPAGQDPAQQKVSGFVSCSQIARFRTDASSRWLFTLLITTRDRETSNAIDHLYGITAMLSEAQRSLIKIDYQLPYVNALLAFCKNCIDKDPNLNILAMAPSKERSEELPTWCPDLAHPFSDSSHLSTYLGYSAGFTDRNQRRCRIQVLDQPVNAISIPGFRLDTVQDVVQKSVLPDLNAWEDECKQLFELSKVNTADQEAKLEAYARTLIVDHLTPTSAVPPDFQAYEVLQATRKYWHDCAAKVYSTNSLYSRSKDDIFRYQVAAQLHEGRKFFSTINGQIGLGPSRLQPDDIIAVLYSGSCLFALRNAEAVGTFTLVGEVYMHGYMDLETTLRRLDTHKSSDESFVVL